METRRIPPAAPTPLTPAETKVATVVASGYTNEETAERLGIASKTVESHLRVIFRKLGVRSRTELALLFHGLEPRSKGNP